VVRRPDTATTGGTQSVETPHEKQKNAPGDPQQRSPHLPLLPARSWRSSWAFALRTWGTQS